MRPARALALALLAAAWPAPVLGATAAEAGPARPDSPLRVRNLSPGSQVFGLPRTLGALAAPGTAELTLTVEHGNNFTANSGSDATVLFDGSTTVASLGLRGGFGGRFEWGVEVPGVLHSGGITDGFIESFHELFGFPDGGREDAPRDRLSYRIDYLGSELVRIEDAGRHLGDLRGWIGMRFARGPREGVLRAMVKAPTGDADALAGSEGTDLSLSLELVDRQSLAGAGVTVTLMAGVTALGDGALAEPAREDWVWSGHLGLHRPLGTRLVLRAQLDAHTDLIDSDVRQFAHGTVLGTLGGTLAVSRRSWLDLGVVEDLSGASAPDVVFFLTLGTRL